MKRFFIKVLTALASLFCCLSIFLAVMFLTLSPSKTNEIEATKKQEQVNYFSKGEKVLTSILITVENCPALFLVKLSSENQKVTVYCKPKTYISQTGDTVDSFEKTEYQKHITFTVLQFDDVINYLGGVELQTPYGIPSPANTNTFIAKNQPALIYGASLSALLCNDKEPTAAKMEYYCYVLSEVCLKFLKNCDTNYYKFLKNNCQTDISYADFYDNFKTLKESIKYTDCISAKGYFKNGRFYLQ